MDGAPEPEAENDRSEAQQPSARKQGELNREQRQRSELESELADTVSPTLLDADGNSALTRRRAPTTPQAITSLRAPQAPSSPKATYAHACSTRPSTSRQGAERQERGAAARRLDPHKLRHTFASILVALGIDPGSVMDQLGHAHPGFTLRVYRHGMRRDQAARERLRSLVGLKPSP
jgi:integrase